MDSLYLKRKSIKKEIDKLKMSMGKDKIEILKKELRIGIHKNGDNYISQRNFYELSEKEKSLYDEMKIIKKRMKSICKFYVSWSIVNFHNGYMEITFEDFGSEMVNCPESKESFNLIKINIIKKMKPIKVIWSRKNRNLVILDKVQLDNVLLYLSIKEELSSKASPSFHTVKSFSDAINNQKAFFTSFFDKSLYLEYWANRQSMKYKIVPVIEKRWNGSSFDCEDAFLFTVEVARSVFIIWESVSNERATYLFKSSKEDYLADAQAIFDYASASIRRKRKMLQHKFDTTDVFYSCKSIYHIDYDLWRNGIEKMLGKYPVE